MYVIIECTSLIIHLENSTTLIFINLNLRDVREKIVSIDVINIPLNLNTKSEGKGRIE